MKHCNKKMSLEKAQAYQNAKENRIKQIKQACQVKLHEMQVNKTDSYNPDLEKFCPLIYAHLGNDSTDLSIEPKFYFGRYFKNYAERNACYDVKMT